MHNVIGKQGIDHSANVESMIAGHYKFISHNTGKTDNGQLQHYILNNEGILSNNRHYLGTTLMETLPNGDATTEGQSLLILGFAYTYLATGDKKYLDAAVHYFDAYIKYFYEGDPIPDTPQRWIANWICNGKEPVLASYPVNDKQPTQGGYKCVPVLFKDGKGQIPHGAPYWGEYLDIAIYIHRGAMSWPAINGGIRNFVEDIDWQAIYDIYRTKETPADPASQYAWVDWERYFKEKAGGTQAEDGTWTYPEGTDETLIPTIPTTNWNGYEAESHLAEYIVAYTNNKIGVQKGDNDSPWGGDILETGLDPARRGEIQLRDYTINGVWFVNYAVKLPVEHGGRLLARNEVWHNRPVSTPLFGAAQRGNAADAELWFCDACFVLWKITSEQRYYNAWKASLFTIEEYIDLDVNDRFFRKSVEATSPFTDGISYDWSYPSDSPAVYNRDTEGYIVLRQDNVAQSSLEQQSVWFKCSSPAKIRTTAGGKNDDGGDINIKVEMFMNKEKHDNDDNISRFVTQLPALSAEPKAIDILLSDFVAATKADGSDYILADLRSVVDYGGTVISLVYREDILDNRKGNVINFNIPDTSSGCIIGFWLIEPSKTSELKAITYESDAEMVVRFTDAEGWIWQTTLPAAPTWRTFSFDAANFVLSINQDNEGEPLYTVPSLDNMLQFILLLPDGAENSGSISYYCINDVPPRYDWTVGYSIKYRLTISSSSPYTVLLGDCTVIDYDKDNLKYVPGVIPFSNIYNTESQQFDGWHGMPYPGYQHPFIYMYDFTAVGNQRLENMANFLWDSQQWYYKRFNQLGPGASAYLWNRWDNFKYGVPDTFTMYHWGNGTAWSGYQCRAYYSAARAVYEGVVNGRKVPEKLVDYVRNWTTWLLDFMQKYDGISPTNFPREAVALPDPDDFTGHMCGLWLAGASTVALCGLDVAPQAELLMDMLVAELESHYDITGVPGHIMDGGWSPALRMSTGSGPESNAMYFGFYTGEILRGLGLYLLYKRKGRGANIYTLDFLV